MRCENCGWDKNPAGSVKCAKCNILLTGSMVSRNPASNNDNPLLSEDPSKKIKECKFCGYVLRPGSTICPNCGNMSSEPTETESREPTKPKPGTGTFIQKKRLAGFLVTFSNSPSGEFFPLYDGRNTIGRDSSNDIVIMDKSVSGEHLVIACYSENRKFYFETVGLTQNGTCVNGVFFPRGGDELTDSAIIIIGSTKLFFMAIPETALEQESAFGENGKN